MKVFGVDYAFLSCGSVFSDGLQHAAESLGVDYRHALWSDNDLPRRVKDFGPDLIFVVHGRRFAGQWKKPLGAPTAVWLLDEPYECDDTASWSGRFDSVFCCDPSSLRKHKHASYLPVCYDPFVHQPRVGPRPQAVGFIGGGNATRERYLIALLKSGCLTYIVGGPWDSSDLQRICRSPNIPASDTARLYQQTRIVINVFRQVHHWNKDKLPATSCNPRIYEATACGCLVISEWRSELDTLCPEMPTFTSEAECVGLVRAALADPEQAEKIRQQCAARLAPHTYAARLQTVLQTCGLEVAA